MAECIHGFDDGLCDICFPRPTAEQPATVGAAPGRVPSAARPPRAQAPRSAPRTGTPRAQPERVVPFATRRLYHATHIRNLDPILTTGALRSISDGADPEVDVAASVVRELRSVADVGDGRAVDQFVPFVLSTDADSWAELRSGAEGAQWSAAARQAGVTQYVMLVVGADRVGDDVVVAPGDSSAPATRFTIGEPARAVQRAAVADPELQRVEVLVPGPVPLEALLLVGVPNEPVRATVRQAFADAGVKAPRIVVHPPWFTPTAE